MENKRIVFTGPGKTEVLYQPIPKPEAGKILVELAFSTISSGTERANLSGEINITPFRECKEAIFPRTSGYSSAGTVIEIGEGVTTLKPGDRVALIWSTHSQFVCVPEENAVLFDERVAFSEAALCHIGAFPMAAIRKCRLEIGESGIVMGLGILGLMAVGLLRAAGAVPIIAVDPVEGRRKKALELGADYVLDPFEAGFSERVRQLVPDGVNVAIEVTGNGKALDQVLDCMARFGRVALLGCTRHSDFSIDYYRKVHGPGIALIGAHTQARSEKESFSGMWTTRDDMRAQMKLIACGRLNWQRLIEEVHLPEEAPQVYERLLNEKSFPIVQFDWRHKE